MDKPQMKTLFSISWVNEEMDRIDFFAHSSAIREYDIDDYGTVEGYGGVNNKYTLYVDIRFGFDEVVAFMRQIEKEQTIKVSITVGEERL